ncbi:uncharacterized protein B0I36DRAFT_325968 [Microdochium trichocladiopsis]|uniref:Uncharacterized protein n=1 Tax=Microdochium trichocladiopsis TaxID=1682393 RepID=A0A9P8Y7F2_9PEZI|nr:uncharacterized protein B0I36DRAFT_325968 [Microdochium trichocladiopsis]KAH7029541.1 hypothetical protein B0I36DRAFT_325968 [Microdochium trichocladiopsis]
MEEPARFAPLTQVFDSPDFVRNWGDHLHNLAVEHVDVVYPSPVHDGAILNMLPYAHSLRRLCMRGADFTGNLTALSRQGVALPQVEELELDLFFYVPTLGEVFLAIHGMGSKLVSLSLTNLWRHYDERNTDDEARLATAIRSLKQLPQLRMFTLITPFKPEGVPAEDLYDRSHPVFTVSQTQSWQGFKVMTSFDSQLEGPRYPCIHGLRYACAEHGQRSSRMGWALDTVAALVPQTAQYGDIEQPTLGDSWQEIDRAWQRGIISVS